METHLVSPVGFLKNFENDPEEAERLYNSHCLSFYRYTRWTDRGEGEKEQNKCVIWKGERERETGLIFQFLTRTYMASVNLPLSHVMFMFSNPERKCKRQNALNGSMHDKASSRSAAVFFFFYTSLSANRQREGIFVFVSHNRTNT